MRGEPEVAVENSLHHLHGVAVVAEVVGDDECASADGCGTESRHAQRVEAFEEDPRQCSGPAHKDRRGVQVGHGGPVLQIDPQGDGDRMNYNSRDEQRE